MSETPNPANKTQIHHFRALEARFRDREVAPTDPEYADYQLYQALKVLEYNRRAAENTTP